MRIIRTGQLPSEIVYNTTCRNCNTHFEFKASEAQFIGDQRDGDCLKVECPLCNKSAYVSIKSNSGSGNQYDR